MIAGASVHQNRSAANGLMVNYSVSGSATQVDYQALLGVVIIPVGKAASVEFQAIDDTQVETMKSDRHRVTEPAPSAAAAPRCDH
jgi:hypothetical protein